MGRDCISGDWALPQLFFVTGHPRARWRFRSSSQGFSTVVGIGLVRWSRAMVARDSRNVVHPVVTAGIVWMWRLQPRPLGEQIDLKPAGRVPRKPLNPLVAPTLAGMAGVPRD